MTYDNRATIGSFTALPKHWIFRGSWTLLLKFVVRSRQRTALDDLDDRLLRDIGVTRSMAQREIDKPFWRA